MARRKRAYRQGDLDGLCGIYAVVNALRHVLQLSDEQCQKLFEKLIQALEQDCRHLHKPLLRGCTSPTEAPRSYREPVAHPGSGSHLSSATHTSQTRPTHPAPPVGCVE
jgi:hypothetical protein